MLCPFRLSIPVSIVLFAACGTPTEATDETTSSSSTTTEGPSTDATMTTTTMSSTSLDTTATTVEPTTSTTSVDTTGTSTGETDPTSDTSGETTHASHDGSETTDGTSTTDPGSSTTDPGSSSSGASESTGPDPACAAGDGPVFDIVNVNADHYAINGENDPALTVVRGCSYTFNVNAAGHPFYIKTMATTGNGQTYDVGVAGNGGAVITWDVPDEAPNDLFYNCQFHPAMTGTITVIDP